MRKQFLSEWGNRQGWDGEGGVTPAGRPMPAGGPAAVPPRFLVYKRRLYVLARKAPVLDHRQASIDSIFGAADEASTVPVRSVRPQPRTAIHPQAIRRGLPKGSRAARTEKDRRDRDLPRFVPRYP